MSLIDSVGSLINELLRGSDRRFDLSIDGNEDDGAQRVALERNRQARTEPADAAGHRFMHLPDTIRPEQERRFGEAVHRPSSIGNRDGHAGHLLSVSALSAAANMSGGASASDPGTLHTLAEGLIESAAAEPVAATLPGIDPAQGQESSSRLKPLAAAGVTKLQSAVTPAGIERPASEGSSHEVSTAHEVPSLSKPVGDAVPPHATLMTWAAIQTIEPANGQSAAQMLVVRRAAAITGTYRSSGEVDAARELRARTRDLPPSQAGEVIVASRATTVQIMSVFDRAHNEQVGPVERVTRRHGTAAHLRSASTPQQPASERAAQQEQVAANLAATIEHISRDPHAEPLARTMASLMLDAFGQNREVYGLAAFALGIPFGTGLKLPLALADELDERGEQNRKRHLLLAVERGLKRLNERASGTVRALIDLTSPLTGLLSSESDDGVPEADRLPPRFRDFVTRNANFLDDFAQALRRLDAVGADVFFALDALARHAAAATLLRCVHSDLLAAPAIAFAVAESNKAREAALERCTPADVLHEAKPAPVPTHRTAQRVYASLGFSSSRSAVLAHALVAWHSQVMIDGGWMSSKAPSDLDERGRTFAALLRFFGANTLTRPVRAIELADIEPANLHHSADRCFGLPLFHLLSRTTWPPDFA